MTKPKPTIVPKNFAEHAGNPLVVSGTALIKGVRKIEIDGRPQLVLDVEEDGVARSMPLDRDTARNLTRWWGHNPVVDAFFRSGGGLQ